MRRKGSPDGCCEILLSLVTARQLTCYITCLYVIHFKHALNSGEAQIVRAISNPMPLFAPRYKSDPAIYLLHGAGSWHFQARNREHGKDRPRVHFALVANPTASA
jgi:hypothetical protein